MTAAYDQRWGRFSFGPAILDTHVHFWDPAARHHDWLAAHPELQRRFGPDDLDPGRHELAGAVFVQADCRDEEALDEVRWVAGAGHRKEADDRQIAADTAHEVRVGLRDSPRQL